MSDIHAEDDFVIIFPPLPPYPPLPPAPERNYQETADYLVGLIDAQQFQTLIDEIGSMSSDMATDIARLTDQSGDILSGVINAFSNVVTTYDNYEQFIVTYEAFVPKIVPNMDGEQLDKALNFAIDDLQFALFETAFASISEQAVQEMAVETSSAGDLLARLIVDHVYAPVSDFNFPYHTSSMKALFEQTAETFIPVIDADASVDVLMAAIHEHRHEQLSVAVDLVPQSTADEIAENPVDGPALLGAIIEEFGDRPYYNEMVSLQESFGTLAAKLLPQMSEAQVLQVIAAASETGIISATELQSIVDADLNIDVGSLLVPPFIDPFDIAQAYRMLDGRQGWNSEGELVFEPVLDGSEFVLTYKFFDADYDRDDTRLLEDHLTPGTAEAFTSEMMDAVREIFDGIEGFTNITFVETTDGSDADLGFLQGLDRNGGSLWSGVSLPVVDPENEAGEPVAGFSDIFVRQGFSYGIHDFGHVMLMHEIGHALGMGHTFQAGLIGAENSNRYSVMSYDWHNPPTTYQLYDIAALQGLYGANFAHNAGDDIYTLDDTLQDDFPKFTIWDGGGIDTLDGSSATTNMVLNLNQGQFSSVGLDYVVSPVPGEAGIYPAYDNIAIAYGSIIENAIGGSADDVIFGNEVNNHIIGGGGDDAYVYGGGSNNFEGGTGSDTADYSQSDSAVWVMLGYGDFQVWTKNSEDLSTGTWERVDELSGVENIIGTAFDDSIRGSGYDNIISSGDGDDFVLGYGGDDTYQFGGGSNYFDGGVGSDTADYAGSGSAIWLMLTYSDFQSWTKNSEDLTTGTWERVDELVNVENVIGTDYDDLIAGDGWANHIFGGAGDDKLFGHGGDDFLYAGAGEDVLTGGHGADSFVLSGEAIYGRLNAITDFDSSSGDLLLLDDVLEGFSGVIADYLAISQFGEDTVLFADRDGQGTLYGFQMIARLDDTGGTWNNAEQMINDGDLVLA